MIDDWCAEFQERITGRQMTKPIAQTHAFIFLFALYTSGLLATTLYAPSRFPIPRAMGIQRRSNSYFHLWIIALLFCALVMWCEGLRRSPSRFRKGVPGIRLRWIGVFLLYVFVGGTVLFCWEASFDTRLLMYLSMQASLVSLIYEVYAHPLLPPQILQSKELREVHRQNWWKFTQLAFSVFAILVAVLSLTTDVLLITKSYGELLPIAGILSILLFVLWKRTALYRMRI